MYTSFIFDLLGFYINNDGKSVTLAQCLNKEVSGCLEIPKNINYDGKDYFVTVIGESAFEDCVNLISVVIPDSVLIIDDYAFIGCYGLTSVNIPSKVYSIGCHAFDCCDNLKKFYCFADPRRIDLNLFIGRIANYAYLRRFKETEEHLKARHLLGWVEVEPKLNEDEFYTFYVPRGTGFKSCQYENVRIRILPE